MEHARPLTELLLDGGPATRAESWRKWRKLFEVFIKASGVSKKPKEVQASLLVNLIGPAGYEVFTTFTFDTGETEDDISCIFKKFDLYFGAKPNITVRRYKVFTRSQEEGENIDQYQSKCKCSILTEVVTKLLTTSVSILQKETLLSQGYEEGTGLRTLTIHEAQGLTFESVIGIKSKGGLKLHDSVPHAVLAVSRHTGTFIYYADGENDANGRFVRKAMVVRPETVREYNLKIAIRDRNSVVMEALLKWYVGKQSSKS